MSGLDEERKALFRPAPRLNDATFDVSGFSADETLIIALATPHVE